MLFHRTDKIVSLISKHLDSVEKCFDAYLDFMEVFDKLSDPERIDYAGKIDLIESEADVIRHEIIHELLEGGLLLDSRKSLMTLIEQVDDIADLLEDISRDTVYQLIEFKPEHLSIIKQMNAISKEQFLVLKKTIKAIVSHYKTQEVSADIRKIEELESQVDKLENLGIINLYRSDLSLAEKNQLRDTYKQIGNISDIIEDISDLVEIIMLSRRV